MKNKLQKRLICHRLIRALSGTPVLLQELFKGMARHRGGSEKHNTAVYFCI